MYAYRAKQPTSRSAIGTELYWALKNQYTLPLLFLYPMFYFCSIYNYSKKLYLNIKIMKSQKRGGEQEGGSSIIKMKKSK